MPRKTLIERNVLAVTDTKRLHYKIPWYKNSIQRYRNLSHCGLWFWLEIISNNKLSYIKPKRFKMHLIPYGFFFKRNIYPTEFYWFLTKFGKDFLWYLKYSWHNKLRDQLINGKVWSDLLYILNVTVQSQMFSVLNVNFGRELLPQGVTIFTLENGSYEVCG